MTVRYDMEKREKASTERIEEAASYTVSGMQCWKMIVVNESIVGASKAMV